MRTPADQQPGFRAAQARAAVQMIIIVMLAAACRRSSAPHVSITERNAAELEPIGDITIVPLYAAVWPQGGSGLALIDAERVHLYDLESLTEQVLPVDLPQTLAFTPSGDGLAVGTIDGALSLWDMNGVEQAVLAGHTETVTAIEFSEDARTLATLDASKQVYIWDLKNSRAETVIDLSAWPSASARIESIRISPDGSKLATLSIADAPTLKLWDIHAGKNLRTLKWAQSARPFYNFMFSPDWATLAWVAGGTVQLMDVSSGDVGPILAHEDALTEWRFSPDGGTFVTRTAETIAGNFTGVIKLWDPQSGTALHTLAHPDFVSAMAFSPDWEYIATATGFGEMRLWDTGDASEIALLSGHSDTVWALAFSPDGDLLASASSDGSVRLWDVHSGQVLTTLIGTDNKALADVGFSHNGDWIATVADDGNITLWGISKGG